MNTGVSFILGHINPYLLKKLKETGCWEFLKKAMEMNIPIYGGSAGAIIFSKTIIHSLYADKNWVEIRDLTGMDVLSGYEIAVHYNQNIEERLIGISKKNKTEKIIALTERNGLYVTSSEIVLLGKEPAIIFANGKMRNLPIGATLPKLV